MEGKSSLRTIQQWAQQLNQHRLIHALDRIPWMLRIGLVKRIVRMAPIEDIARDTRAKGADHAGWGQRRTDARSLSLPTGQVNRGLAPYSLFLMIGV